MIATRSLTYSLIIINLLVIHSNPTPLGRSDPVLAVDWLPINVQSSAEPVTYMDISGNLEMKRNPEENRLRFWDRMYEKYNGPLLQ